MDDIKDEEYPDILLNEATQILTDLAGINAQHDSVMSNVNQNKP
jgi:hypothetical protein